MKTLNMPKFKSKPISATYAKILRYAVKSVVASGARPEGRHDTPY